MVADEAAQAIYRRFAMTGRRALVTGGSVSIGRAVALCLAEAGADVAVQFAPAADAAFGVPDAAAETAAAISAMSRRVMTIGADFAMPGEATRAVQEVERGLGGVDVLVICASVQQRYAFTDLPRQETDREFEVNFAATVELLQAVLPGMAERGWGRVLSIGSINQTRPEALLAIYAALKAATHNLVINLAREYAPHGVTLNTLSPGLVATERNRWRREDAADWARLQREINPMGRAAMPEEMAGAALLLCSDAGAFITGADLQATGGGHL